MIIILSFFSRIKLSCQMSHFLLDWSPETTTAWHRVVYANELYCEWEKVLRACVVIIVCCIVPEGMPVFVHVDALLAAMEFVTKMLAGLVGLVVHHEVSVASEVLADDVVEFFWVFRVVNITRINVLGKNDFSIVILAVNFVCYCCLDAIIISWQCYDGLTCGMEPWCHERDVLSY